MKLKQIASRTIAAALVLLCVRLAGAAEAVEPNMPGMPSKPQPPSGSFRARIYVNGQENGELKAGAATALAFEFTDASGQTVRDFELDDTKYMHLVIVRNDHSTYAHVHPSLDGKTGQFILQVNQANADPDNQDAVAAMPDSGVYDLYIHVLPKGEQLQAFHLKIRTVDADQERRVEQKIDGSLPDQKISKNIAVPTGAGRCFYRTALSAMIMRGIGPTLNLHLEFCQTEVACQPVADLEPWLGMGGHAVLISQDGVVFRHWHAGGSGMGGMPMGNMSGEGNEQKGPNIVFMAMDNADATLPPGNYNIWLTVKRQGQIIKLPYFVRVSDASAAYMP